MVKTRLIGLRHDHHIEQKPLEPKSKDWIADDSLILAAMWDTMDRKMKETHY